MGLGLSMATAAAAVLGMAGLFRVIAWGVSATQMRVYHRHRQQGDDHSGGIDRCAATTADGQRCVRLKVNGHSRYCWQH
jgi:hypothetical protein